MDMLAVGDGTIWLCPSCPNPVPFLVTPPFFIGVELEGDEWVMTGFPFSGPMGCGGDHPWLSLPVVPPERRLGLPLFPRRDPTPLLTPTGTGMGASLRCGGLFEFNPAREEFRGEWEGPWEGPREVFRGERELAVVTLSGIL